MNSTSQRIYDRLLSRLLDGVYLPGQDIPYERDLAREFGSSIAAVKQAMGLLVRRGLLERCRHRGSRISSSVDTSVVRSLLGTGDKLLVLFHSKTPTGIFWSGETIEGFCQRAGTWGYQVIRQTIDSSDAVLFARNLELFLKVGVEGLVLLDDNFEENLLVSSRRLLEDCSTPVLRINRMGTAHPLSLRHVSGIEVDHYGNGYSLGELLALNRCTHSVIVSPYPEQLIRQNPQYSWCRQKLDGLLDAFGSRSLPVRRLFAPLDTGELQDILRQSGQETVLVPLTMELSSILVEGLKQRHLSCGRDFHLVTFDDLPQYGHHGFTALSFPKRETGHLLADLACRGWHNDGFLDRTFVSLSSDLVIRDSFRPKVIPPGIKAFAGQQPKSGTCGRGRHST